MASEGGSIVLFYVGSSELIPPRVCLFGVFGTFFAVFPPFLVGGFTPVPVPETTATTTKIPCLFGRPSRDPGFSPPIDSFPRTRRFLFSHVFCVLCKGGGRFPVLRRASHLGDFLCVTSRIGPVVLDLLEVD